jgi:hypothetical protein
VKVTDLFSGLTYRACDCSTIEDGRAYAVERLAEMRRQDEERGRT